MARVTEDSLIGQIRGLSPGQSFSRSTRLDFASKDRLTATEALQKLRNLVNQAVGRIRKEDEGSNFRVESVCGITDDKKAMIATVAVTNMAGGKSGATIADDEDDEEVDI